MSPNREDVLSGWVRRATGVYGDKPTLSQNSGGTSDHDGEAGASLAGGVATGVSTS
jgi:hypothetical protein